MSYSIFRGAGRFLREEDASYPAGYRTADMCQSIKTNIRRTLDYKFNDRH